MPSISYKGIGSQGQKSGAGNGTFTVGIGSFTAGQFALLSVYADAGTASCSAGWTAVSGSPFAGPGNEKLYLWYRFLASGDSDPTITISGASAGDESLGWIQRYLNVSHAAPLDVGTKSSGTGTSLSNGGVTPSDSTGRFVVVNGIGVSTARTGTPSLGAATPTALIDSGSLQGNGGTIIVYWANSSGSASGSFASAVSASGPWVSVTVNLRPAANVDVTPATESDAAREIAAFPNTAPVASGTYHGDTLGCDPQARVILKYPVAPSIVVQRSNDGSNWADITSNCTLTSYSDGWKIIDKRPAYGSEAVGWQGDTAYYRVVPSTSGGVAGAASQSVSLSVQVDKEQVLADHAAGMARLVGNSFSTFVSTRTKVTYVGYDLQNAAYFYERTGNSAHLTNCQAIWDEITTGTVGGVNHLRADDLWKYVAGATVDTYVHPEHTCRNVIFMISAAQLLKKTGDATAITLADTILAQCDTSMKAVVDLLSTTTASQSCPAASTVTTWSNATSYLLAAVTGSNATDTFTKTAHGLSDGVVVYLSALTGGSGLTTGTPYYVITATTDTFQLSLTSGGAAVDLGSDVSSTTVSAYHYDAQLSYVQPTTPNGYIYQVMGDTQSGYGGPTEPTWPTTPGLTVTDGGKTWVCVGALDTWVANTAVVAGYIVRPTTRNGRSYRALNAGTTHATTQPTWPTTDGGTVTDNGITWQETTTSASAVFYDGYDSTTLAPTDVGQTVRTVNVAFGIGAAFALATKYLSSFTSAGSYRTAAFAAVDSHMQGAVLQLQLSDGAIPYSGYNTGYFLDTSYGAWVMYLGGVARHVLGPSYDATFTELFLNRVADWMDTSWSTEPNWTASGTTGAHAPAASSYEMGWRDTGYYLLGRSTPTALRDLQYTTAFQHDESIAAGAAMVYRQAGWTPYNSTGGDQIAMGDGTYKPYDYAIFTGAALLEAIIYTSIIPATETDAAQALSVAKRVTLTPAVESDAAVALSVSSGTHHVTLTPATETSAAVALTASHACTLTPASESDAAVAVTFTRTAAPVTPSPPEDPGYRLTFDIGPYL